MPIARRSIASLLAAAALTLSACGGSDDASTLEQSPPTVAASANFNADDVMFAQGMIPHHSQAVAMASIALEPDRTSSDLVRDLAQRIQSAQDPEIEQMTEWLTAWDQPLDMPVMDGTETMDGMDGMDGMVASADLDALAQLDGPDFDAEWIRLMIAHHEGAVAMAQAQIASGSNQEVISLAENIVATQRAEIDEMR